MNETYATSGNSGPKVRSDCAMTLGIKSEGGITIDITSKVKTLFGASINTQCREILSFFGISNAHLIVDDSGALPFVLSARLESTIKQLFSTESAFLPEMLEENKYSTTRDRFRFSRLYIPGNTPSMIINAGLHSADGIILDLEDSVSPEKKDEARILVRNALRQVNLKGSERMVRINQGERGIKDLEYVIPHNVNLILIPKCESPESVWDIEQKIHEIKVRNGTNAPVHLMPIIETALGVEMAFDIARSSQDVVALAIGLEDLTADMGVSRTTEGKETFYARTRIVNAAKAAGIQPIDSVFAELNDMDALRQNVMISKALGFEGMGCIHPRQIPVIKQGFAPGPEEIEKSKNIVLAFEEAQKKGVGVVAIGSKMIDPPVVKKAQRIIDLSTDLGLLSKNWKNEGAT